MSTGIVVNIHTNHLTETLCLQEYKYLSEPYSEDIDQDAARRLLEFGDDYRKYIDSDGASSFSGVPPRGRRTPPHRRLRHLATSGPRDLDSDSDLDDLHHVIDQSRSQLTVTENVLKKYSSEAGLGLDYVSILPVIALFRSNHLHLSNMGKIIFTTTII